MRDAGSIGLIGGGTVEIGIGLGLVSGVSRPRQLEVYRSPSGVAPTYVFDARINRYASGNPAALQPFASNVTFTRAGSKTGVLSSGMIGTFGTDVPAFVHDPVSLSRRGLSVEASRTNLLLRSQELGTSPWSPTRATVSANLASPMAPDGTQTADRLVADATPDTSHFVQQSFTAVNGAHVYSRFVRAGEISQLAVAFLGGTTSRRAAWNLATGTVADIPIAAIVQCDLGIGIEAWPGGWYRVWAAWTADGQTGVREHLAVGGTVNVAGNVSGQGLSLWGAQLEPGSRPTSYIPTTDTAVTRAADSAVADATGWVAAGQGTLIAVGRRLDQGIAALASLSDGTIANRIELRQTGARQAQILITSASVAQLSQLNIGTAPAEGEPFAAAVSYSGSRVAVSLNGGAPSVFTGSYTIPTTPSLRIGRSAGDVVSRWNGTVARALYYPTPLSDADIQAITAALAAGG